MAAIFIGSWLPNIVGLLFTWMEGGKAGLRELAGKIVLWRIGAHWYAAALLVPAAMGLLAVAFYVWLGRSPPDFAPASQLLPILLASDFTGALGEELGWRGTALPRLRGRLTPLLSSLVLGGLWAVYSIPAFLLSGTQQQGTPMLPCSSGCLWG
jgi:membrane protease YdiL (CAAX protease family)